MDFLGAALWLPPGRPVTSWTLPGSAFDQLSAFKSEFPCRSIGKDITSTYSKLEKLTLLAKRKTIFDDKPVEIQKLTNMIKQDIANLNKQIGQLQTIAK